MSFFKEGVRSMHGDERDVGGQGGNLESGEVGIDCWLLKRHLLVVLGLSEELLLVVHLVVEPNASDSEEGPQCGCAAAKVRRVRHEEIRGVGVQARHPHEAAPADVVTRTIQRDVQGVEVTCLPPEELGQVDRLREQRDFVKIKSAAVLPFSFFIIPSTVRHGRVSSRTDRPDIHLRNR